MDMFTLLYLKRITNKIYCVAHGTQLNVMWQSGWEGSLAENGYMYICVAGASLVAQTVKHPPAMQETRVQSLGWEDPLEKATHSNILAQKIPWTEETGGLQSMGLQRVGHN